MVTEDRGQTGSDRTEGKNRTVWWARGAVITEDPLPANRAGADPPEDPVIRDPSRIS
jgi:hypothetical protein